MTLTFSDDHIISDRSPHTARLAPGPDNHWEVSWLPGRQLSRSEAVTAMVIADTAVNGEVYPGPRAWPHIDSWAAELGMTRSQALDHVADPPQWTGHQEKTAKPPGPEPPDPDPPDTNWPDPLDLGWPGDPDWPDPDWSEFPRGRPTYMFNLQVSPWYKEHYPGRSANLYDALRAGRDPQPAPEPDKQADWEAGQ